MPIISDRTTIYNRDGSSVSVAAEEARNRTYFAPHEWSLTPPAPVGWESEPGRYFATQDLHASPNSRHKFEPPFSTVMDPNVWQYLEQGQAIAAGDEVITQAWPHPSMRPISYGAKMISTFFATKTKSRLPRSPFRSGKIDLDDGLSGPMQPNIRPPQMQPLNLRPVA